MSTSPSVPLNVCLSECLSFSPSVFLSASPSLFISLCLYLSLTLHLFLPLHLFFPLQQSHLSFYLLYRAPCSSFTLPFSASTTRDVMFRNLIHSCLSPFFSLFSEEYTDLRLSRVRQRQRLHYVYDLAFLRNLLAQVHGERAVKDTRTEAGPALMVRDGRRDRRRSEAKGEGGE